MHCPKTLKATVAPQQELMVIELHKTLLQSTGDLRAITREFINSAVSRASLGRCLRRHGDSSLLKLATQKTDKPVTKKLFKDYEPGFLHIDVRYLPQMPDETERRYLFIVIDCATRWVFMEIYADQSNSSSTDFLIKLNDVCPIAIVKLLTDNGNVFTNRFTSKKKDPETGDRIPSGKLAFDVLCQ